MTPALGPAGETKQEVLDDITDLLDMRRREVSRGSSVPSDVFARAAVTVGVPTGSMPEVCEAVVTRAGMPYLNTYDSRSTVSGGGSTVTVEGMQAFREALKRLL